jgi:hypothetical protein
VKINIQNRVLPKKASKLLSLSLYLLALAYEAREQARGKDLWSIKPASSWREIFYELLRTSLSLVIYAKAAGSEL